MAVTLICNSQPDQMQDLFNITCWNWFVTQMSKFILTSIFTFLVVYVLPHWAITTENVCPTSGALFARVNPTLLS